MQRKQSKVLVFLLLWVVAMIAVPLVKTRAAATLEVVEIDYDKETLTVKGSPEDKFLYYSDSKQKNWECAHGQFGNVTYANGETCWGYVLDISWVKKTKDYDLRLKGDVSTEVVSVKLPVQNRYFKVKYNYLKQEFEPENQSNRPLQWRKADSTIWHNVVGEDGKTDETVRAMNKLYARGAYIYVRTEPENGTSAANPGMRPSKEIKISLKKQASAPSVSMKTAGILTVNTTHEYQVAGNDTWTKCDTKTLDLGKIATKAFYQGETPGEDVMIYVRVAATEKKLPSASTVITVRAQEAAPGADQMEYSPKNATALQVKIKEIKSEDGKEVLKEKPSSKNPYEYTVVKPAQDGTAPNPDSAKPEEDATWTAITSETITISEEKAPKGSIIFIRKKGRLESKVVYQPESLACKYVVDTYPEGSSIELVNDANDAAFMEDVTTDGKTVSYLRLVKEQGNTDNSKLMFKITTKGFDTNIAGITCGGKKLSYTVTKSAITIDNITGSAIIVTISSTEEYEKALKSFDTHQPVAIQLANGEVISGKVTLKILPGASVEKKAFKVTHRRASDQTENYTFTVSAGILLNGSRENIKNYTEIKEIKFLNEKLDCTISPEGAAASYTVTIPESSFDKAFLKQGVDRDKAYPVVIEMKNGQMIESGISVELHENLKVENVQSISFPQGMEQPEVKIVFTGASMNTESVTWNGQQIAASSNGTDTTTTVTIPTSEWQKLQAGENAPIIFEFTDGSKVSRAVWLKITASSSNSQ